MFSNFLRFPMAFLGGAFIPVESMPPILQTISRLLPLTYSIEALNQGMAFTLPTAIYAVDMVVLVVFSAFCLLLSSRVLRKKIG